ncbi:hypothetical protein [Winogradskyella sp. PG-2]|uniref:hypothetical protein n=1 Tax=Winogradskyella sp. PG-2 TaxID=754409 RepID=UPI00045871FC|nr:hypothetical protein [Winogradskyella sp. PG-2]BAO75499.1 hypothetical protein WPG_1269 [Winogradskyella sp. PG-2]
MTKEMNTSFKNSYHHWTQRESIIDKQLYSKLLNWTSGEFDLYLQDEANGLEVFFPKGKLSIKTIKERKKDILIEINIKSKDLSIMNTIGNQIISIYNQIERIYFKPIVKL